MHKDMTSSPENKAPKACAFRVFRRFKPHLLMILVQMSYTALYFITEAAFNSGLNPHVYVTYRHIVGGLVMFPIAYFTERYIIHILTHSLKNLNSFSFWLNFHFFFFFTLQKSKAKDDIICIFGNIFAFFPRVGLTILFFNWNSKTEKMMRLTVLSRGVKPGSD